MLRHCWIAVAALTLAAPAWALYKVIGPDGRITYTDVQNVQNIWTARKIEVFDSDRNSRTTLSLDKLQYNVPLKDEQFTLQALRRES